MALPAPRALPVEAYGESPDLVTDAKLDQIARSSSLFKGFAETVDQRLNRKEDERRTGMEINCNAFDRNDTAREEFSLHNAGG